MATNDANESKQQRHSSTTRITHWGSTVAFALLFGTGAAIYDHRPKFQIGTHSLILPNIPAWLTITASPKIIHYVFAAIFVLCGIYYLAWGLRSGHFKRLILTRADAAKLIPMQLYYLGLRKYPPAYDRYNPLQKLAYSAVLFVISPLIVLSGTAMLPIRVLHPLGSIFVGGVKLWHFGLMDILCAFILVHLAMVVSTGLLRNLTPMIVGKTAPESTPRDYVSIKGSTASVRRSRVS